jgi:hypothetical protein
LSSFTVIVGMVIPAYYHLAILVDSGMELVVSKETS